MEEKPNKIDAAIDAVVNTTKTVVKTTAKEISESRYISSVVDQKSPLSRLFMRIVWIFLIGVLALWFFTALGK